MKKPQFVNNRIYHIYNRGVEKRKIFLDKQDHLRFIHNLFELNDKEAVINTRYYFNPKTLQIGPRQTARERRPRKLLVEILIFTLMPNHFHLLLRQKAENGIVKFMQKLGTGYTMYFNQKYQRVGSLFQGSYKAAPVVNEPHFIHLPFYIHSNPIDLISRNPNYRGLTSIMKFLQDYRWSSFPDYIGINNFPSVTSRDFLSEFSGGPEKYKKEFKKWLSEREEYLEDIKAVKLE